MKLHHRRAELSARKTHICYRKDISRAIITLVTVFVGCGVVIAQKKEIPTGLEVSKNPDSSDKAPNVLPNIEPTPERAESKSVSDSPTPEDSDVDLPDTEIKVDEVIVAQTDRNFFLKPEFRTPDREPAAPADLPPNDPNDDPPISQSATFDRFYWKPALAESMLFLGIQHSFRMLQIKTRQELDGEFFADWGMSVKNLGRWRDGDSTATNYFAHPLQGAVTGWIFVNNSDRSRRQEFGKSKKYWESRFKALVWSTVWSAQFELGPISEASIGNVGLYDREGPNRMGWVDLVITPTAGTGVMIGEDVIDKYILRGWLEKKLTSTTKIRLYRTFFTPVRSFTNVLGGRMPWKRYNR